MSLEKAAPSPNARAQWDDRWSELGLPPLGELERHCADVDLVLRPAILPGKSLFRLCAYHISKALWQYPLYAKAFAGLGKAGARRPPSNIGFSDRLNGSVVCAAHRLPI